MRNFLRSGLAAAFVVLIQSFAPAAAEAIGDRFARHDKDSKVIVDHSGWTRLLAAHVIKGADGIHRINYARMKAEAHPAVKRYVAALEAVQVSALSRPEQFAFWANLYNAKTVDIVLDNYPVKSIKDIRLGGTLLANITGGPWKAKVVTVEGVALSLDDIEHSIMRPIFKDPRVHYAVNCASIGCPNLPNEAFTGTALEEQLEAAARAFVNHPRGVTVSGGRVKASSIYSWFQADFGNSPAGVLEHVRKHASPDLKKALEGRTTIDAFEYDWGLNDAGS